MPQNILNPKKYLPPCCQLRMLQCNTKELDLVAETREVRDIWVDAINHTLGMLTSLTHQREYEM